MRKADLTTRWRRWRRAKFGQLVAQGLPTAVAYVIADADAKARRRIGRIIGHAAAEQCQLLCTSDGDDLRFQMVIGQSPVESTKMERLQRELGVTLAALF
jgi:hypothetical protein